VHIPALRQVSMAFQDIVDVLLKDFMYPAGIQKVTINYITGNLLILYENEVIQEKRVLDWLSELATITGQIWLRFKNDVNGNAQKIGKNLLHFFTEASKNGIILDKNFKIPDYVWN
jgi:hypothetical protein